MRKTREEKAITLIALIITIVVLLILAVVAINAVTGDGIIQHATNAKTEYEKAQDEEEDVLSYYTEYLETKGDLGPWKKEGDKLIRENKDEVLQEIEIGSKVSYKPIEGKKYTSTVDYNGSTDQTFEVTNQDLDWRVLGVENGKIMLISNISIKPNGKSGYTLKGIKGYQNGIDELDKICSIYGNEYGNARSLKLKDIEEAGGITESEKEASNYNNHYGSKFKYEFKDGIVQYTKDGTTTFVNTEQTELLFVDNTKINSNNLISKEVIDYSYSVKDLASIIDSEVVRELLLISGEGNWVATNYCMVNTGSSASYDGIILWGLYGVSGKTNMNQLFIPATFDSSNYYPSEPENTVRPVIVLDKNAVLNGNNVSGYTISW